MRFKKIIMYQKLVSRSEWIACNTCTTNSLKKKLCVMFDVCRQHFLFLWILNKIKTKIIFFSDYSSRKFFFLYSRQNSSISELLFIFRLAVQVTHCRFKQIILFSSKIFLLHQRNNRRFWRIWYCCQKMSSKLHCN